ncbi:arabinose efflux permease family protein [Saccharomonospora marina XMU15]|uniref:Arabinose efflux permease family protein n=1 Tax=Saccharomonospora marina XMU15 TaxID=882083 RepID=H5X0U8_9PSEU|nr:MFS transporter [Saccharomonospora marina]EHR51948.1 arabinose efflux permease family protein [Saccharomonospora marina XMU15]
MPRDSLWLHRDFRLLWAGDTASQFGTFVGRTALPLLAATTLAATPLEMGLLTASENAAFLLLGLPAGVWVDRMRRRPLMLRADLARGVLLLSVPLAWWAGVLSLPQLIVVALLVSVCTLFFDIAYQSYLPSLVGRSRLVEGNGKLQVSQSVAQVSGPGLAGALAQLLGAANAVATVGLSYLGSAALLGRIRTSEPPPSPRTGIKLRAEVGQGLRFVFGNRHLRAVTACTASGNFAGGAFASVEVLFLSRELRLPAAGVGAVLAVAGVGGLLGALSASRWLRRVGQARAVWLVPLLTWPAHLLVPLAEPGWRVGFAALGLAGFGYGVVVYNVAQVSYRQAICPDGLLGRMNASVRFVVWGVLPVGGLLGGVLGEWLGVRATVWITSVALAAAVLWVLCSPLRLLRDIPADQLLAVTQDSPSSAGDSRAGPQNSPTATQDSRS